MARRPRERKNNSLSCNLVLLRNGNCRGLPEMSPNDRQRVSSERSSRKSSASALKRQLPNRCWPRGRESGICNRDFEIGEAGPLNLLEATFRAFGRIRVATATEAGLFGADEGFVKPNLEIFLLSLRRREK